jgi:hypothetical protein
MPTDRARDRPSQSSLSSRRAALAVSERDGWDARGTIAGRKRHCRKSISANAWDCAGRLGRLFPYSIYRRAAQPDCEYV